MRSLIEMGAALACGQQVFLISDGWWSVQNHPLVRKFRKLEGCGRRDRFDGAGEQARRLASI